MVKYHIELSLTFETYSNFEKNSKIALGLFLVFPPADHEGKERIISAFSGKSYIALAPHLLNLEIGHIFVFEQFYIHFWCDILTYMLATFWLLEQFYLHLPRWHLNLRIGHCFVPRHWPGSIGVSITDLSDNVYKLSIWSNTARKSWEFYLYWFTRRKHLSRHIPYRSE